jgi:hypothetical protein
MCVMVKVSVTRGDIPPDSGRSKRIAKFKRDLVLDLFLRRGQFWEAIKEARQYCDHVARPAMPPQNKGLLLVFHMDDAGWSAYGEEFRRKLTEKVPELERQVVPDALRDDLLLYEWGDFLAACIAFDPPAERLTEFAEYGGPTRVSPPSTAAQTESALSAGAPPIQIVPDPFERDIERIVFMFKVIDAIEEEIDGRHPEIGVKSIIQDILDDEDLVRPLHSRLEKIPKRYFLDVREDTSLEDIKHGYQVIKGLHGSRRNKSGAPARDPLIAVQCALLYDKFNEHDSTDRRRRKWTYKRLSEQFELKSARAAREYVITGREVLKKN